MRSRARQGAQGQQGRQDTSVGSGTETTAGQMEHRHTGTPRGGKWANVLLVQARNPTASTATETPGRGSSSHLVGR